MKFASLFLFIILFISCKPKAEDLNAQAIVDKAIETSCGYNCENMAIDFIFRGRQYSSKRDGGAYSLERITTDSTGVTHDILTNEGFSRFKNESLVAVVDSMATKYANSVNSVHYFALLPYGLNAAAVKKELLGERTINEKNYYEIEVTFIEEGGGTDFDDTFVYWFSKQDFSMDYLAYAYATDGGGIRFREAYNKRAVEGIRFTDYNNYKPESLDIELTELPALFEAGKLKLLSKIETEDVKVSINSQS